MPKSKGGKTTQYLHRICHRQIHALFTETELANQLNTASALQAHPEMKKFISWVQTKPEHFYEKTRKSARVKARQASQIMGVLTLHSSKLDTAMFYSSEIEKTKPYINPFRASLALGFIIDA
ncbi:hypothetical protein [Polynucleobacter necessarius]|uniref:hypothetical protein n=1 Tax=Polynucleobacter necessarius TaxID=576610 RepID=UPI002F95B987